MHDSYVERVRLLLDVAPLIFTLPDLAMKGGTAINLFLRDMPRLSVDIDLVYTELNHGSREEALAAINGRVSRIAEMAKMLPGVSVRVSKREGVDPTIYVTRNGAEIKVETNFVFRGTVYQPVAASLTKSTEDLFRKSVRISMLDPDELYASKLVAALDRQHPRDLFDVMNMLAAGGVTPRMRRAFVVYMAGHNRPMHEVLAPNKHDLRVAFESEFVGMTREPVELARLEEARDQLLLELPGKLDDAERRFLLSIKTLNPDWELLGINGIERLPAIQWKLVNLKRLAEKNRGKHQKMLEKLRRLLEL